MARWKRYEVEILDEPYVRPALYGWPETRFEQTARVRFFDDNDDEYKAIDYGYVTPDEVLADIQAGKEINLSRCYVKRLSLGLSLSDLIEKKRINITLYHAEKAFFDDGLDFTGACFAEGSVSFENAIFGEGDVSFESATFGEGYVSFKWAQFGEGYVSFDLAQFGEGDVSFNGAQFGEGNVSFYRAAFCEGDVSFNRAQFGEGNVSFDWAEFGEGDVSFNRAQFGEGDVRFDWASFGEGDVSFYRTIFGEGKLDFCETTIDQLFFYNCSLRNEFDFTGATFNRIEFIDCTNYDFINIRWRENNLAPAIEAILHDRESTRAENHTFAAETALLLKENFRKMGRYDDEDCAYFVYRKHRLRASFWRSFENKFYEKRKWKKWGKKLNLVWSLPLFIVRWLFLEALCGYGVRPFNTVVATVLTWVGFGAFYFHRLACCGEAFGDNGHSLQHMSRLGQAAYHSIITFLTIGYGDIYPDSTALRVASGIEGYLGLFLMAVFTVSFMRKVLR